MSLAVWRATALIALSLPLAVFAESRQAICAKDQGGKVYQVDAVLITGAEMNAKTGVLTWGQFTNYVVIFWDQTHASAINIGGLAWPSAFPMEGVDQQGRKWTVSVFSGVCY